jgi:hypothetical protein
VADKYELVRTKLQNKIFTPYGIAVDRTRLTSPVENIRGEIEDGTPVVIPIDIVPYSIFSDRESNLKFGDISEGDLDFATQYDTDILLKDSFIFEGNTYNITQIEPSYLKEKVVQVFRATKQ